MSVKLLQGSQACIQHYIHVSLLALFQNSNRFLFNIKIYDTLGQNDYVTGL